MTEQSCKPICVTEIHSIVLVSSINQHIDTDVCERSDHGLIYKVSGHVKYHIDGRILDFSPGTVCWLPKGSCYRIERLEKGEAIRIHFDTAEDPQIPAFSAHFKNSAAFAHQFSKLLSLSHASLRTFDYRQMAALYELIDMLDTAVRIHSAGIRNREQIRAAAEYLGTHYADPNLSISALADRSGLAPSTLRSSFAKVYGIPPVRYLGLLRLNAAKAMLTATDRKIEEIAEVTGFGDSFYFSKYFRKSCGVTPSEYRKMNRAGPSGDFS